MIIGNDDLHSVSSGFQSIEPPMLYSSHTPSVTDISAVTDMNSEAKPEYEETPAEQDDFKEQYERLRVRHKHILEERDTLARQVQELRRQVESYSSFKHDTVEEISLLNKLIDEEQALREKAREKGNELPAGYDAFTRHDKFVTAFLTIVSRNEQ